MPNPSCRTLPDIGSKLIVTFSAIPAAPHTTGSENFEAVRRGGSGVVFGCDDKRLGRVAVKLRFAESTDDEGKLQREATLMQRVAHPHICKYYEHFALGGGLSGVVLELLDGGSLAQLAQQSGGRMAEQDVTTMALQILEALGFMHSKQVIHRDVKPANIMRCGGDDRGAAGVYKLIDLGIAAVELGAQGGVSETMQTGTTGLAALVGTPHYMSPEQLRAGVVVTHQTDLWSLGVVMFTVLTGACPFAPSCTPCAPRTWCIF